MRNKSELIREYIRLNPTASNKEIKAYGKAQGVMIASNLIAGVAGSEKERLGHLQYGPHLRKQAESFINLAGGFDAAKRLLYVAAGGMPNV